MSNVVFSVVVVIGVVDVVVVVVVIVRVVVVGVVCWCFALSARIVDHGCFSSIISVRMCVFSFRFFCSLASIAMRCLQAYEAQAITVCAFYSCCCLPFCSVLYLCLFLLLFRMGASCTCMCLWGVRIVCFTERVNSHGRCCRLTLNT